MNDIKIKDFMDFVKYCYFCRIDINKCKIGNDIYKLRCIKYV